MLVTKNYTFGIPSVSDDVRKILHDQARLAHNYRNALVGIECDRRAAYRALRSELSPELAEVEKQIDVVNATITEAYDRLSKVRDPERPSRSLPRHKRDTNPESLAIIAEIKAAKDERRALWDRSKELRALVFKEHFKDGAAAAKDAKRRGLLEAIANDARKSDDVRAEARRALAGEMDGKAVTTFIAANLGPRHAARSQVAASVLEGALGGPTARLLRLEADANEARKRARAACGCSTGTYLAVENAADKSFEETMGDPRRVPWDGSGSVGSQMRGGGISVTDAISGTKQIAIAIDPTIRLRGGRGHATVTLQLEAGVRIEFPIVVHREIPRNGTIKWAYVDLKRIGLRTTYQLRLNITSEEEERPRGTGLLAINLGWRAMPDGSIRVATTWDGVSHTEVRIPAAMRDDVACIRETLGRSDVLFDDAREIFADWLSKTTADLSSIDERTRASWATVRQWRSHKKLVFTANALRARFIGDERAQSLWRTWKAWRLANKGPGSRFGLDLFATWPEIRSWLENAGVTDPDEQIATYLDWWRVKDRHLTDRARGVERRVVLRRREIYRVAASSWVKTYDRVVIEQWNKSQTAKSPAREDDMRTAQEVAAAGIRQLVGVSVLVKELAERFGKNLHKAPAIGISRHYRCGGDGERLASHIVECERCAKKYDQDHDAARTLFERSGGAPRSGAARNDVAQQNAAE